MEKNIPKKSDSLENTLILEAYLDDSFVDVISYNFKYECLMKKNHIYINV